MEDDKNKKSYSKYGGKIPGDPYVIGGPLDDESIDRLLESSKRFKEQQNATLKNSYGYDFENVYKLEKERMAFNFFPYPYISYFGIDPENEQLIKVQKVDRIYQPGNVVNCTPDRTYYVGTTSWYDGFGFEIKREVRHVNDLADLAKLKDTDVARVITRENGLIKINEKYGCKDEYFDTGSPILPDYTEGKLKYPTSELPKELGESIKKIFDRTQFEGEAKPISVKEHIDEEEILSTFDNNMRFTKKFEHPNWNSYREKRKTELNSAIEEQKIKQSIAPLEKRIEELEAQNRKLQCMLNKTLEFAQTVRDSAVGKIFFGKKAKEVLGNQDKDTKQLSDGR